MDKISRLLKKIFCPPTIPAVLLASFGYVFVILVFALEVENPVLRYISFFASAYALTITIVGLPRLSRSVKKVKEKASEHTLVRKLRSTSVGGKYLTDVRFRNRISLHIGLTVNLAYIIMKLSTGIYYRSAWLVSLAVYYILLALMRLSLIRYVERNRAANDISAEFRRYRLCGIILLLMNQALAGIVIFMVYENRGFDYPGMLIYAMALYAFYAVITAIVRIVKTRRHKSPILSAAKAVNLVAAMVSMLSLTTAMLSQFGDGQGEFRRTMIASVGGGVCTIVIGMAIFMIVRANISIKKIEINNFKT